MYYEQSGMPRWSPALFLHGGPGSSCNPNHRRFFDPAFYASCCSISVAAAGRRRRVRPPAIRRLNWSRTSSGCASIWGSSRWLLFGGSWGSTLALAYAQTHPERVSRAGTARIVPCLEDELRGISRACATSFRKHGNSSRRECRESALQNWLHTITRASVRGIAMRCGAGPPMRTR